MASNVVDHTVWNNLLQEYTYIHIHNLLCRVNIGLIIIKLSLQISHVELLGLYTGYIAVRVYVCLRVCMLGEATGAS